MTSFIDERNVSCFKEKSRLLKVRLSIVWPKLDQFLLLYVKKVTECILLMMGLPLYFRVSFCYAFILAKPQDNLLNRC